MVWFHRGSSRPIKSDQLTRLWRPGQWQDRRPKGVIRAAKRYFADEDGSGRIDLFEFMRMAGLALKPSESYAFRRFSERSSGVNSNGEMTDEYYEVAGSLEAS